MLTKTDLVIDSYINDRHPAAHQNDWPLDGLARYLLYEENLRKYRLHHPDQSLILYIPDLSITFNPSSISS